MQSGLLLRGWKFVAVLDAGQVEFIDDVDLATRHEMSRSLRQGRRVTSAFGARESQRQMPLGE